MLILFCDDPLEPRRPDSGYEAEYQAAKVAGHEIALFSFESIVNEGDAMRATRRVPIQASPVTAVYRGWMLRPEQYTALHSALAGKGVNLINDPAAYLHCHHLPESYAVIQSVTPRTVWVPTGPAVDLAAVHQALGMFGDRPIVMKDYVKSRKHEWEEACFIPSAADREAVDRVVLRFLELQGDDLAGGLVFREFIEFEPIGTHPKSGMPLTREHRIFWLDGRPLLVANYWENVVYGDVEPPVQQFCELATRVRSRFFTMDVARAVEGKWMVVELGDGQVAGLPADDLAPEFYRRLATMEKEEITRE